MCRDSKSVKFCPFLILFFCAINSLTLFDYSFCFASQSEPRWWQRETLQPSTNQILNPRYVSKKRELEQTWDLHRNNIQAESRYRSMGQQTDALRLAAKDTDQQIKKLEYELETIRPYLTKVPMDVAANPQVQSIPLEAHFNLKRNALG